MAEATIGKALLPSIQLMHQGQLIAIRGMGLRCMHPGKLYQLTIEGEPKLLGLNEVCKAIASMPEKIRPPRQNIFPEYPETIKGISVGGAYSYLLCTGLQEFESRTRSTSHRGWTFVQVPTSDRWDDSFEEFNISQKLCPKGSIIGAIEISECTYDQEYDVYLYHVSGALLFDSPIPNCKGKRTPVWKPGQENIVAFNKAWKYLSKALREENEPNSQTANQCN